MIVGICVEQLWILSRVCIEGNCDGPLDGIGSCSLVKTDLKWLFSVLALS